MAVIGDRHRAEIERALTGSDAAGFQTRWCEEQHELEESSLDCVVLSGRHPRISVAGLHAMRDSDVAVIVVERRADPPEGDPALRGVYVVLDPEDLLPRLLRRTVRRAVEQRRTENRLRQSQRQLAEAQRVAQLGSWEWDVRRDEITWSEELYAIAGLDPRLQPLRWADISRQFHPDDFALARGLTERALATGDSYSVEHRIVRPDGEVRWLHLRGEVICDEQGDPIRMRGVAQDITERVAREAARRASDERFHKLFEASLDAMLLADDQRRLIAVNPAGGALLGAPASELRGRTVDEFTAPELRGDLPEAWERMLQEGTLARDWKYCRAGGEVREVEMGATARIAPGQHLAIVRDITVRKRTEIELERRLDQQAAVARLGGQALAGADLQHLMSQAAAELAEHLEVEHASVLELQRDNQLFVRAGVGWADGVVGCRAIPADPSSQAGYTLHANGPVIVEEFDPERFTGSPILAEHGIVSCVSVPIEGASRPFGVLSAHSRLRRVFTGDDVSFIQAVANVLSTAIARSRAEGLESQLRQRERLESVGQLAGGIAHDFNNLLAVILNYAGFAVEQLGERPDVRSDIEEVLAAARRGAALTRQLLLFSRRELVRPELVDVNAGVAAADGLLRRTLGEHIRLQTDLDPETALTELGAGQLEQVVLNLAVNARDAMPDGGSLTIATRDLAVDSVGGLAPDLRPGRYALVSVADSGTGMSPEVMERAFEPFFTTKPRDAGTGLGLATVYGIATEAGGEVAIQSEPGLGTTVNVYLPAAARPAAPTEEGDMTAAHGGNGELVLVVEDEEAVRAVTERILRTNGYRVIAVEDGEAALDVFREDDFDLLVTDLVMPRMSGQDLARRAAALRGDVRVLFMSGYPDEVISRARLKSEGMPLLEKPFSSRELLESVRRALAEAAADV